MAYKGQQNTGVTGAGMTGSAGGVADAVGSVVGGFLGAGKKSQAQKVAEAAAYKASRPVSPEELERQRKALEANQAALQQSAAANEAKAQQGYQPDPNAYKIGNYANYQRTLAGGASAQQDSASKYAAAQAQLIKELQDRAAGRGGKSVAELQLAKSRDQAIAAQAALAASQRGANPYAAARMAAQQGGDIMQKTAADAATLRAQEQQQAQGLLAQVAGQARGQSEQMVQYYLSQGMTLEQAQMAAKMQQQQLQAQIQSQQAEMANQRAMQATGLGSQAALQQYLAGQGVSYQEWALPQQIQAQIDAAKAGKPSTTQTVLGSLIGAGGMIGAGAILASDKQNKQNIDQDVGDEMRAFLDALKASGFEYKGEGKQQYGVMAQDVEKSKAGKSFVIDTPEGKMLDVRQGLGVVLAAQAEINKRLKKLEGGK